MFLSDAILIGAFAVKLRRFWGLQAEPALHKGFMICREARGGRFLEFSGAPVLTILFRRREKI
jgi:hypothetical protein